MAIDEAYTVTIRAATAHQGEIATVWFQPGRDDPRRVASATVFGPNSRSGTLSPPSIAWEARGAHSLADTLVYADLLKFCVALAPTLAGPGEGHRSNIRRPREVGMETHDFKDGNGPVPAHRHTNPDGTPGGMVAETAYVAPSVYMSPFAQVYDTARVVGDAQVYESASVYGGAYVGGHARLSEYVRVYGSARVGGEALLTGHVRVYEHAWVFGAAWVRGYAQVYGNARVHELARITDRAGVSGFAHVFGHARIGGRARVFGHARVSDRAEVIGESRVFGTAQVSRKTVVFDKVLFY